MPLDATMLQGKMKIRLNILAIALLIHASSAAVIDAVAATATMPASPSWIAPQIKPTWRRDPLGRVVLLAPRGAEKTGAVATDGCSRSAVAALTREFAGSGIDFAKPFPPGVSLPPPLPAGEPKVASGAVARAMVSPQVSLNLTPADVRGLTGSDFASAIADCGGLDSSFFDLNNADALAAVAEPRVQDVVDLLNADLATNAIPHAARIVNELYYLRAASYIDSYTEAINYSASMHSNAVGVLVAVTTNDCFLDDAFIDIRYHWAVDSDNWLSMPMQMDKIVFMLNRYLNTPAIQNIATHQTLTEGNTASFLLYGMSRTAWQDSNWIGCYSTNLLQVLSGLALQLPDHTDIEYIINNAIYLLGHLRSSEPQAAYQGPAHQILSQVLQTRAVDRGPYLTAMSAIEGAPYNSRLAGGTPVDVAGYRIQLANRVFSHTYTFDNGTMTFRTPLDAKTIQQLYDALREDKAQFFRVTQALRPADNDPHASLTLRIYGSRADYVTYQPFLYGLGTANGGIYIENLATFFTYQRTPQESIYTLEELTRHEYIHYLDGYYLLIPSFGDAPWYSNDHMTWHSEGLAEFLDGSRRTNGVVMRWRELSQVLPGTPMAISEIIGATYASGFGFYPNAAMFFTFLHEQHPELLWPYFHILYTNSITAYDTLTQGWRSNAVLQAEYTNYLANAYDEVNAGTRITAEMIPTGYKPDVLFGATTNRIAADITTVLPAGLISATNNRFAYTTSMTVTRPDAAADAPEKFQADCGNQLDLALQSLTGMDTQYVCTTGWFELLGITNHTATAAIHLEGWYNPNTSPTLFSVATNFQFDTLFTDDAGVQTLGVPLVNTSLDPLWLQSVSFSGPEAGDFDAWWDDSSGIRVNGHGAIEVQISTLQAAIRGLSPGWHTVTLNILTSNGVPPLIQLPVTLYVAAPLFVDQHAAPGGDGSSWSNAFQTISSAIAAAPTGEETIFVAAGNYAECLTLRNSLHLYGGFSGLQGAQETRCSQRQPDRYVTTLSAASADASQPVSHTVSFAGSDRALIDGFIITGGQATNNETSGGGVYIANVTGIPEVRNCIIQHNHATGCGGGIEINGSGANIANCAILQNTSLGDGGGGISVDGNGTTVNVTRCWIAGNDAGGNGCGGGIDVHGNAVVLVENSSIVGNTANGGAGAYVIGGTDSQLILRGTLVAANVSRSWFGGAANYSGSQLLVEQCVFSRNQCGPGYGFSALGSVFTASTVVRNSIFEGHQTSEAIGQGWGSGLGPLKVQNCLFYHNVQDFHSDPVWATGAAQLNALTNIFTNALTADPGWMVPPLRAGVVTAATYDASNALTLLTLSGAALAANELRGLLLNKGSHDAAAVLSNTVNTITVLGRHDTLSAWSSWQPMEFHLTNNSPGIDTGITTASALDPDGFPRGIDLPEYTNGPGNGFDIGLYEYHGSQGGKGLLAVQSGRSSMHLTWPQPMPGWQVYSSTDLRHWRLRPALTVVSNAWQQLAVTNLVSSEFFKLVSP